MDPQEYEGMVRFLRSEGKEEREWPSEGVGKRNDFRRNYRRLAKTFTLGGDGELRKVSKAHGQVRVVCGEDEMVRVIQALHADDIGGGHFGVEKTYYKISTRYWWRGLYDDISSAVRTCMKCQQHNPLRKAHGELHPVAFPDRVFAQWGMDLVGPLTETPRGNKYIMTLTSYVSRWAVAYAIADKTATTVCDCLGVLISEYSVPERIISDQGREFVNQLNEQLCADMHIKRSLCTAYHPQSLTERFNQTICNVLSKMAQDDQSDWDVNLKWALMSYRTCRQSSIKATPFKMMYGVEARLPVEADNDGDEALLDLSEDDLQAAIEKRYATLQELPSIQRMGKSNIEGAQAKQKGIYDAKHKGITFQVLYYNARNAARKGGKMEKKYLGPIVIAEILPNGTARLEEQTLHSTKFFKHFNEKDTSITAPSVASEVPCIKYVYRPPTVQWQKKMCARLGLKYQRKSAPDNRAFGTIFGYSAQASRLLGNIVGDGNCLFRAFSYWLTGAQDSHAAIRRLICDRLLDNGEEAYVASSRMHKDAIYGTIEEVMAMSELLDDLPIITLCSLGGKSLVQAYPADVKSRDSLDYSGMYLDFRAAHYEIVMSVA